MDIITAAILTFWFGFNVCLFIAGICEDKDKESKR